MFLIGFGAIRVQYSLTKRTKEFGYIIHNDCKIVESI